MDGWWNISCLLNTTSHCRGVTLQGRPIDFFSEENLSFVCVCVSDCDTPEQLTMERAHAAMEGIFHTLRGLSQTRDHLKLLRSVYTASDGVHQVWGTRMTRPNAVFNIFTHNSGCHGSFFIHTVSHTRLLAAMRGLPVFTLLRWWFRFLALVTFVFLLTSQCRRFRSNSEAHQRLRFLSLMHQKYTHQPQKQRLFAETQWGKDMRCTSTRTAAWLLRERLVHLLHHLELVVIT